MISTQTAFCASQRVFELEVIPELPESGNLFIKEDLTAQKTVSESGVSELVNDQFEIIPELPEPEESIPSGGALLPELVVQTGTPQPEDVFTTDVDSKQLLKPSFWRCFKISITPACCIASIKVRCLFNHLRTSKAPLNQASFFS